MGSVGECGVGPVLCGGLLLVPVRKEGNRGYEQIPGMNKELLHCEYCEADCELLAIPTRMAFLFLSRLLLLLPLPLFVLLRFYDLMSLLFAFAVCALIILLPYYFF